jgi:hypothetical protein
MGKRSARQLNGDSFDCQTMGRHNNTPPPGGGCSAEGTAGDYQTRYRAFITNAEKYGLPTRFLREVEPSFSISQSWFGGSGVYNYFNVMSLAPAAMQDVDSLSADARGRGASGITTIYHESTHAWFKLKAKDPRVAEIIQQATDYYQNAPLQGGGKADDAARVFTEAAACYVGDRVGYWWLAFQQLSSLASADAADPAVVQKFTNEARRTYDKRMAERVFGYQETGGILGFFTHQTSTTRQISDNLREFLDETLLEGKVPDHFDDVEGFQALTQVIFRRHHVIGK